MASGAKPSRPTTSGWFGVPSRTIVYPSSTSPWSWRCSPITHEQVPSIISRPRSAAADRTAGVTPWARITTVEPGTASESSAMLTTPRAPRSAITPSLWTTCPRVWVRLPASADSLALSTASRTP